MTKTDWSSMLRLGVINFGFNPHQFWQLSFREWQTLTQQTHEVALSKGDLAHLMQEFPD